MKNEDKFTGKAGVYDKYRPDYPAEAYEFIIRDIGLAENAAIADIGAGTGIFCMPLIERGYRVFGVEPNADMKAALDKKASAYKNYQGINSTAENTGLADNSVDLITVAQAFHWFDRKAFKKECRRILKPDGKVVLLWNVKDEERGLIKELNELNKKFCPEYKGFAGGISSIGCEQYDDFFKTTCRMKIFANDICDDTAQSFVGRCLSSSYALKAGEENYGEYVESLKELFLKNAVGTRTVIKNNTVIYWGEV